VKSEQSGLLPQAQNRRFANYLYGFGFQSANLRLIFLFFQLCGL